MQTRTALLAGATGLTGAECLRLLLASSDYSRVVALARRPLGIAHDRLTERIVDFDRLAGADLAARRVFCALGTTIRKAGSEAAFRRVDHDYVLALARRALECGARTFVLVSSVGANARSSNFYLRVKGETEAAISQLAYDSIHILRPGILTGPRAESRPAERAAIVLATVARPLFIGPLRPYAPIAAAAVARAMIAAARHSEPGVHIHLGPAIAALALDPAARLRYH